MDILQPITKQMDLTHALHLCHAEKEKFGSIVRRVVKEGGTVTCSERCEALQHVVRDMDGGKVMCGVLCSAYQSHVSFREKYVGH